MSRVIAIVQARTGSSRLPGKVLLPLAGRPMLSQQLARLRTASRLDAIAIATTVESGDDAIAALAAAEDLPCYRGSEADVLSRYVGCAAAVDADLVVRITADCPVIDGATVDRVVEALCDGSPCDYAANVVERTFPRGLDAEAMHRDVLERMHRLGTSAPAREHVTWFAHERSDLFVVRSVTDHADNSDLSWTVDTSEDFAHVSHMYDELGLADAPRPYSEILAWARKHAHVAASGADSAHV